jgi:hypothetical protein
VVAEVNGGGVRKVAGDMEDGDSAASAYDANDVNAVTTRESMELVYRELKGIKVERARAETRGDVVRMAALDEEVERIEARIRTDTTGAGKIRKSSTEDTRAQAAITRAVNRCHADVLKLKDHQAARQAFVDHFRGHLRISFMCRYDLPLGRDWRVVET